MAKQEEKDKGEQAQATKNSTELPPNHPLRAKEEAKKESEEKTPTPQVEGTVPRTLILDSLTSLDVVAMAYALTLHAKKGLGGAPAKHHYVPEMWNVSGLIRQGCSFNGHFVVIAHDQYDKDELTGRLVTLPLTTGKYAVSISKDFDEVYHTHVEESSPGKPKNYLVQTQASPTFNARSYRGWDVATRTNRLDPLEVADFEAIHKKLGVLIERPTKWLVIGPMGTGKTAFASTFPTPVLWLDLDNRADSYGQLPGHHVVQFKADAMSAIPKDFLSCQQIVERIVRGETLEQTFKSLEAKK